MVFRGFLVSHTAEMLEERGKKLPSQPGKSIDDACGLLYLQNNNDESNQVLHEKIWLTMIYQDLSSLLISFIRLVIGNCFKNHFAGTRTHRFLTNQNAHNYSDVLLRNWSKTNRLLCRENRATSPKDHASYDGCKEKTNLVTLCIQIQNPYFLERLLAGACNNCL